MTFRDLALYKGLRTHLYVFIFEIEFFFNTVLSKHFFFEGGVTFFKTFFF